MNKLTISDFLNSYYKDYSFEVVENRAIPCIVDGFKPTQRKIIHTANKIWKTYNEKEQKVFILAANTAKETYYAHGDASLHSAIVNLAQSFKNNIPLLEEHGQFGSLRDPNAGAPRYIATKLSRNFRKFYKDFELLEYLEEEGNQIEPKYFYSLIPMNLVNGSNGIAIGFASNILNRNYKDVIKIMINYLQTNKIDFNQKIKPFYNQFSGDFEFDSENNRWIIKGKYKILNKNSIEITELPLSMTFEKFENHLNKLIEKKVIYDYNNNSKDNVSYIIHFKGINVNDYIEDKILSIFKLIEYETENFTLLNENKKIIEFNNEMEIIKYFTDFRLSIYEKRKEYLLKNLQYDIKVLNNKLKFLKMITTKEIDIFNKSKDEVIKILEDKKIEKIDGDYEYILKMNIYSFTKEKMKQLYDEKVKLENEYNMIKEKNIKEWYIEELNELMR